MTPFYHVERKRRAKKTGGVYTKYRFRYRDEHGKIQHRTGTTSYKQTERIARKLAEEAVERHYGMATSASAPSRLELGGLLERFLTERRATGGGAPSTTRIRPLTRANRQRPA